MLRFDVKQFAERKVVLLILTHVTKQLRLGEQIKTKRLKIAARVTEETKRHKQNAGVAPTVFEKAQLAENEQRNE